MSFRSLDRSWRCVIADSMDQCGSPPQCPSSFVCYPRAIVSSAAASRSDLAGASPLHRTIGPPIRLGQRRPGFPASPPASVTPGSSLGLKAASPNSMTTGKTRLSAEYLGVAIPASSAPSMKAVQIAARSTARRACVSCGPVASKRGISLAASARCLARLFKVPLT